MAIIATGIDLAKNVFAVHGVNESGKVDLRQPRVARAKLNALTRGAAAGIDRHGGLLWSALLGARVSKARAHGAAGGAQAGHAVLDDGQARQERSG